MATETRCALCGAPDCTDFAHVGERDFLRCPACSLIFVPPSQHLSLEAERQRYGLHTNSFGDSGYVRYLQEVADWVRRIPVADPAVLDFGSGENQVLSALLNRQGIHCTAYDPLYRIGLNAMSGQYDVVVVCEVIEHLRNLQAELQRVQGLLKPSGFLLLRTELVPRDAEFRTWWYVQDPTHINFFSRRTLDVLCRILCRTIHATDEKRFFVLGKQAL